MAKPLHPNVRRFPPSKMGNLTQRGGKKPEPVKEPEPPEQEEPKS